MDTNPYTLGQVVQLTGLVGALAQYNGARGRVVGVDQVGDVHRCTVSFYGTHRGAFPGIALPAEHFVAVRTAA